MMLSEFLLTPKSLVLVFFIQSLGQVLGDAPPYLNNHKFEDGAFGAYPIQRFRSSSLVAPRLNILTTHSSCNDGSYTMLNPRGNAVPDEARGPVILDAQGSVVWAATGYQQTYDLMVQQYKGEDYLTFWTGNDAIAGHGNGEYVMMNSSYKEVRRIKAANGLKADLHECRFTDAGTALITIYDVQKADLTTTGGPIDGYVWDSVFQELDIETGELIFQWRATDHFDVADSYHGRGKQGGRKNPWDFFHINSIEKDTWGNYLISARYTSTVSYINGTTGEVIWVLGGRRNGFVDYSGGRATGFRYQHDARWHDNYTTITIFNNGARAPGREENSHFSSGMRIRVNTTNSTNMTAKVDTQYIDPLQVSSSSQGNMQVLPNGNVLLGYGYNGAFTEFTPSGVALCETHFGAKSRFHTGDVQSYRAMKFNWTATPHTNPDMAVVDGSAYVSWNGATEVHEWVVERGDMGNNKIEWRVVLKTRRVGFETEIPLPSDHGPYVRVTATNTRGDVLGVTRVITIGSSANVTQAHSPWESIKESGPLRCLVFAVAMICFGLSFSWLLNTLRQGKKVKRYKGYSEIPMDDV